MNAHHKKSTYKPPAPVHRARYSSGTAQLVADSSADQPAAPTTLARLGKAVERLPFGWQVRPCLSRPRLTQEGSAKADPPSSNPPTRSSTPSCLRSPSPQQRISSRKSSSTPSATRASRTCASASTSPTSSCPTSSTRSCAPVRRRSLCPVLDEFQSGPDASLRATGSLVALSLDDSEGEDVVAIDGRGASLSPSLSHSFRTSGGRLALAAQDASS